MRAALDLAVSTLALALEALDEVGRLRAEVSIAHRRLVAMLRERDADKTPVRPPSLSAMQAFHESASFRGIPPTPKKP